MSNTNSCWGCCGHLFDMREKLSQPLRRLYAIVGDRCRCDAFVWATGLIQQIGYVVISYVPGSAQNLSKSLVEGWETSRNWRKLWGDCMLLSSARNWDQKNRWQSHYRWCIFCETQGMLCWCTCNPALQTLSLGTTFRLRNRSRGTKVPQLNAGYIEHVNTIGDGLTVLWLQCATQDW